MGRLASRGLSMGAGQSRVVSHAGHTWEDFIPAAEWDLITLGKSNNRKRPVVNSLGDRALVL